MMYGKKVRPPHRPDIAATEGGVATTVQYSVRNLGETDMQAVHYRVRRLLRWEKWQPISEPSFYTYDAACRFLGRMLRDKNARLIDPVVRESAASSDVTN